MQEQCEDCSHPSRAPLVSGAMMPGVGYAWKGVGAGALSKEEGATEAKSTSQMGQPGGPAPRSWRGGLLGPGVGGGCPRSLPSHVGWSHLGRAELIAANERTGGLSGKVNRITHLPGTGALLRGPSPRATGYGREGGAGGELR